MFTVSVVTYGKVCNKEESIEILKILGLLDNTEEYQKIMISEENISQEFRLKNIDETRN